MKLCVELIPCKADFAVAVKPDVLLYCVLHVREGPQLLQVWLAASLHVRKVGDVEDVKARIYNRIRGVIVSGISGISITRGIFAPHDLLSDAAVKRFVDVPGYEACYQYSKRQRQ